jgi:ABC-type lipoprotein release transport system permease subunit
VGVQVVGVKPSRERHVSRLRKMLVHGRCFALEAKRRVVLGYEVARTLGLEPKDQLVMTSQAPSGELRSDLFTLCGVIRSGSPQIDRSFAVMPIETAHAWLGMDQGVTHIAVRVADYRAVPGLAERLRGRLNPAEFQVLSWEQVDPMVSQWVRFSAAYGFIILTIVVALTIAQVSNTMVMSVYDRLPEFGLMQALGTRSGQLFAMVAFESLILVVAGGSVGYGVGAAAVAMSAGGIDFSALAGAFEFFFMKPVIHPLLTHETAVKVAVSLGLATILGGIYPAWRASRIDPLEAMK